MENRENPKLSTVTREKRTNLTVEFMIQTPILRYAKSKGVAVYDSEGNKIKTTNIIYYQFPFEVTKQLKEWLFYYKFGVITPSGVYNPPQ